MADKRISQLVARTDIANNDVVPIVASGASTTNKATISSIQTYMQENLDVGVTSVGLTMPSAFSVSGSPVTTSGNISVTGAGTVSQYIRGDGSLADFPQGGGGGGASVNYYLNGSVSQGTIGGIAYREMNRTPILGTGTDFVAIADGYLASFITDAGDPALLEIPAGNWNFETYFSASSGGGSPSFYVELYKVNSGGTATLIASNSGTPELIAFGTTITPYFSALAVPTTTLTLTDRLALRYYVARSGRTITLHTENGHLCQIITTFTTGLTALNGLTAQVQNFTTGTSGTDFGISSTGSTHTFNLPDASATARGVVTTGIQTIAGIKNFTSTIRSAVSIEMAATGTALPTELKNINGPGLSSSGSNGIGFNSSNNLYFAGSEKGCAVISMTNTGTRTYTLQDTSGVIALTSNIPTNPLGGSGTINQIPKYTSSTTTLGNSNISDNGTDVGIASRTAISLGGQSIILTPNLGGTTNRIETTGSLPLALVSAAAITMAAGGTTPQITLATTGAVTLTGALNGTSGSFTGNISAIGNSSMITVSYADIDTGNNRGLRIINSDPSEGTSYNITAGRTGQNNGDFVIRNTTTGVNNLFFNRTTGAATFSSSVTAGASGNVIKVNQNAVSLSNGVYALDVDNLTHGSNMTAAGAFRISTNGNSGAFVVNGVGNVGIGTASPAERLHVETSNEYQITYSRTSIGKRWALGIDNNGTYLNNRTDSVLPLYITNSGNIGIGNFNPLANLQVGNGTQTALNGAGNKIHIATNGTRSALLTLANSSGGTTVEGQFESSAETADLRVIIGSSSDHPVVLRTNNTERMRITSGGAVQIGTRSDATESTANLTLNNTNYGAFHWLDGTAYYIGQNSNFRSVRIYSGSSSGTGVNLAAGATSWGTYSDERLKENIENIDSVLPKLSNLRTVKYHLKNIDTEDSKKRLGLIAQDLVGNFDEVLSESRYSDEDETEYYDVRYTELIPVLIKAIQELKTEIDLLKTKSNESNANRRPN